MQADKLLGPEISDVDGVTEERTGTISIFNGPEPIIRKCKTFGEEIDAVSSHLEQWVEHGLTLNEIGVFVRSENELNRAKAAVESAKFPYSILDEKVSTTDGNISICTMHLAKGLEFRAVAVMAILNTKGKLFPLF